MPKMIKMVAACAAATLLASCSGIGKGNKPVGLRIVQVTPDTALTTDFINAPQVPGKAYTCVRSVVQAFIVFDNGDLGNFTRRVRWSSSDPSRLTVSNFDEVVPGNPDARFDYGSLAPLAETSSPVTITAEYQGLTATIPVTVAAAGPLEITPSNRRIATKSFQPYRAYAELDGRRTDVTTQTFFTVEGDDEDDVADPDDAADTDNFLRLLTEDNTVQAVAPGGPFTLGGRLNVAGGNCATSASAGDQVTVEILDIPTAPEPNPMKLGLSLEPEDGYTATLAEGTSQFLKLVARFGDFNSDGDADDDDEKQDLSTQAGLLASFASSNEDAAAFIGSSLLGRGSLVFGNTDIEDAGVERADATSDLTAAFGALPGVEPPVPGVTTPPLTITVRDLPLRSIELTASAEREPVEAACTLADSFGPMPPTLTGGKNICFKATGTFGPGATPTASDYVQDITKDVAWSTTGDGALVVRTGLQLGAGLASSLGDFPSNGRCAGEDVCPDTVTATFTFTERDAAGTVVVRTITAESDISVVATP